MEGTWSRVREPLWQRIAWPRWATVLLIWLAAFVVRLVLVGMDRVVWGDEPFYLWLGKNWVTGKGFAFVGHPDVHHGPLFPVLAGLLYLLTHDLALASEVLYLIFGSLLVWPVYALGEELYGRRAGLIAAALVAALPGMTVSVLHWGTMTEPLYMFFVYLGLWAGLLLFRPWLRGSGEMSKEPPWWAYGVAGLSFGLAYLTRPEAIGYFAVVGGYLLLVRLLGKRLRERRFWLGLVFYLLAFGVAFLPYAYYVRVQTGSWMVSEKVGVAYLTGIGLAHGDTAAFDKATWGLDSTGLETFFFSPESYNVSMLHLILDDPKTFAIVLYLNVQRFAKVLIDWTLFPYLLLPLVVLGLFDRGWTRERTIGEVYLLLSILPVLGFVLFYIQARYILPFAPVLLLWTGRGLLRLGDWLVGTVIELRTPEVSPAQGGRPYRRLSRPLRAALGALPTVLVLALLLMAYPQVLSSVTNVASVRPAHKTVGQFLSQVIPSDSVIMCRYPAIAFYAQARWVPTPNASWPEVLRYARHKKVDYFVIDERELRYRPQFKDLVTGEHIPKELKRLYVFEEGGERLVVYQFIHTPSSGGQS